MSRMYWYTRVYEEMHWRDYAGLKTLNQWAKEKWTKRKSKLYWQNKQRRDSYTMKQKQNSLKYNPEK